MARAVIERYSDWRSLTDSEAFMLQPDEIQLGTADIWISATAIGEPFDIQGSNGWKAVEILVNSNAPTEALRHLFERLGGLYRGGI